MYLFFFTHKISFLEEGILHFFFNFLKLLNQYFYFILFFIFKFWGGACARLWWLRLACKSHILRPFDIISFSNGTLLIICSKIRSMNYNFLELFHSILIPFYEIVKFHFFQIKTFYYYFINTIKSNSKKNIYFNLFIRFTYNEFILKYNILFLVIFNSFI